MKKYFVIILAFLGLFNIQAQTFSKGDMVVDLGVGLGVADATKINKVGGLPVPEDTSTGTFTQKLGFEYGVVDLDFGSIGIGALVTNAYGFGVDGLAVGEYDYTYQIHHYRKGYRNRWEEYQTTTQRRNGVATGEATTHVEDVNILLKGSFHKEFVKGLDTYATLGLGASIYTMIISPKDDVKLASDRKDFDANYNSSYQMSYSYDDAQHVEWQGASTKARFAMALFIGARYYLNSNWGIFCEVGLTSASFKKNAGVYNLLSLGASYKF